MTATAHLTLAAPDNEKFTVQSAPAGLPRRKPTPISTARASNRARDRAADQGGDGLLEPLNSVSIQVRQRPGSFKRAHR